MRLFDGQADRQTESCEDKLNEKRTNEQRKGGRMEGRKEGRKEERKEGRKCVVLTAFVCVTADYGYSSSSLSLPLISMHILSCTILSYCL